MTFSMLERRTSPRMKADLPISIRYDHDENHTPAHMVDLSSGGAALLATEHNAPMLGQYLEVMFDTPTNDGATESRPREELAVVVNLRKPQRDLVRFGVRFVHPLDFGSRRRSPRSLLGDSKGRKSILGGLTSDRWSFTEDVAGKKTPQREFAGIA